MLNHRSVSALLLLSALTAALSACNTNTTNALETDTVPASVATGTATLQLESRSSVQAGLHLNVSIGRGKRTNVMLDTGSTGVVIAKQYLGTDYTPTGEAFQDFTYSSSGNSYSGEWVTTRVRLYSSSAMGAESVATVPMRVRMVTKSCKTGEACVTDEKSIGISMMGIGFDRVDPHGTTVDQTLNPFLNLTAMGAGGSMKRGYVLTPKQVTLGITDDATASFNFIKLQKLPAAQGDDWQAPAACVSVPTANVAPQCGSLLVDTGLNYAIIQVPDGIDPPQHQDPDPNSKRKLLDDGQQVVVTLPDLNGRTLYSFTVGDAATGAPTKVAWGHSTAAHNGQPFMNTGMYTLSQLDYAYDADQGRVGFRFHALSN